MKRFSILGAIIAISSIAGAMVACGHRAQVFDSHVKVTSFDIIRRDADGKPLTADLEVEWTDCPGEQREVARVDAAFASCFAAAHKAGDTLPVRVSWGSDGYQLDWDIVKVAECDRSDEPDDDVSFDMVHTCVELKEQGQVVGFRCDRKPSGELLKVCPWFQRH